MRDIMKKICIVAAKLEDYQLLKPLMDEIGHDDTVHLTILSTDCHASEDLNMSYYMIEQEGIKVDENLGFFFNADADCHNINPKKFGMPEFVELLKQINPEIVVLYGDSYESYSAGLAAMTLDIPIAHIGGGEAVFREWEDSFRYGLTKLSHLHFCATEKYRQRIIHFGEHPDRIFNVGDIGIEKRRGNSLPEKSNICETAGFEADDEFIFVSYHAFSGDGSKAEDHFSTLLDTLSDEGIASYKIIFKKTSPIGFGKMINEKIDLFIRENKPRACCFESMDQADHLGAVKHAALFIGNCSKGIVQTPSFKTPMINVGQRQDHRIKAANIIDCTCEKDDLLMGIEKGLSNTFKDSLTNMVSPFEQSGTTRKIKQILKAYRYSDVEMKTN